MAQMWVLVGGNGAGKSTFYTEYLKAEGMPFVNADQIAKERYPDNPERFSYEAAREADVIRETLLASGANFCFETVYSHPSKIDFLAKAKALGYTIYLVLIGLGDEALHIGRVYQRVHEGGHSVPIEKINSRILRAKSHVLTSIPLVDELWVIDNSSADEPFNVQLKFRYGALAYQSDDLRPWVLEMFADHL